MYTHFLLWIKYIFSETLQAHPDATRLNKGELNGGREIVLIEIDYRIPKEY